MAETIEGQAREEIARYRKAARLADAIRTIDGLVALLSHDTSSRAEAWAMVEEIAGTRPASPVTRRMAVLLAQGF
jgi:hypothetical protein